LHDEVADVLRNSWPTSLRLPFPKQRVRSVVWLKLKVPTDIRT
jgi:hypothetical protein